MTTSSAPLPQPTSSEREHCGEGYIGNGYVGYDDNGTCGVLQHRQDQRNDDRILDSDHQGLNTKSVTVYDDNRYSTAHDTQIPDPSRHIAT